MLMINCFINADQPWAGKNLSINKLILMT